MRRIAAALAAVAALAASGQAMYRWVDEKGVTHFSQHPPPDGKAQKVEVKPSGPAPRAVPPDTWKQRDLDSRARRLERKARDYTVRRCTPPNRPVDGVACPARISS